MPTKRDATGQLRQPFVVDGRLAEALAATAEFRQARFGSKREDDTARRVDELLARMSEEERGVLVSLGAAARRLDKRAEHPAN